MGFSRSRRQARGAFPMHRHNRILTLGRSLSIRLFPGVLIALLAGLMLGSGATAARGQVFPNGFGTAAPGVLIDTNGHVSFREADEKDELAAIRARARNAAEAAKN